ncbi:MAG: LPXTG cell wall anchor domain-containing protein [Rhodoferax sp.]|nr:LPXTG cell wall anchor domain-containing protein [Rhodoferax sp.]
MNNFLLLIGGLAIALLALLFIRRRRQTSKPEPIRTAPSAVADTAEVAQPDAFAEFEAHIRSVFDFALLNSGYGSIQVWVQLRRAIKDIFLSIDDTDTSPAQAKVRQLAQDLGQKYGLFVWAYDRHTSDDKNHLANFVAAYAPRPWEGLLGAEPQRGLDCYQGLPSQADLAFLVVTKSGILMAQREQDPIAEGLLWGVLADAVLSNYDTFGLEARNALDRLLDCGTQVILALPGGFDVFAGPFGKLHHLLRTLQGEERKELRAFAAKLKGAYGEKFKERYGRKLPW